MPIFNKHFCDATMKRIEWIVRNISTYLKHSFIDFLFSLFLFAFSSLQDMAWIEISHDTSEEHEMLIDLFYEAFYNNAHVKRKRPWLPHTSLAYDNPEFPIPLEYLWTL